MALDLRKKFVSAQYLENKLTNFTKFDICIHIDKIYPGTVTSHFSHICTRVMALDLCQSFLSAQYLESKLTEFHICMHIDKI